MGENILLHILPKRSSCSPPTSLIAIQKSLEIMSKPKLTLYVDTVSPFAYLAFHIIRVSNRSLPHRHILPVIDDTTNLSSFISSFLRFLVHSFHLRRLTGLLFHQIKHLNRQIIIILGMLWLCESSIWPPVWIHTTTSPYPSIFRIGLTLDNQCRHHLYSGNASLASSLSS